MEGSVGAPPQRVCPKCARISWATGPQCPYCTARFTRTRGVTPWMLALTAAIVLIGVGVMFIVASNNLDHRVADVQKEFDASLAKLRKDSIAELDSRVPPGAGSAVPTAVPTPLPTPAGDGATTTPSPTPSAAATSTPAAQATPTDTAHTEIRP